MDIKTNVARWHDCLSNRSPKMLHDLLAPDAVFHSPVVWTPQVGRPLVEMYLQGAFLTLLTDDFKYNREVSEGMCSILEFETVVDGITVQGVDMITWNDAGQIADFKVMIRPLKAIQIVQEKMAEMLERMKED